MQVEFIAGKGIVQTADASAKSITTAVDMSIMPEAPETMWPVVASDWKAAIVSSAGVGSKMCAAYGNGRIVAVGVGVGTIVAGTGLVTITGLMDQSQSAAKYSICYGNGMFVAVGDNICVTSSDTGATWTKRSIPAGVYRSVCYGDGWFFAAGDNNAAAVSRDGVTWQSITIWSGDTVHANSVCYRKENSYFYIMGENVPYCYLKRPDAPNSGARAEMTATSYAGGSPVMGAVKSAAYGGGVFVAVGNAVSAGGADGGYAFSSNGSLWGGGVTAGVVYRSICYAGGGMFVAVGDGGASATFVIGSGGVVSKAVRGGLSAVDYSGICYTGGLMFGLTTNAGQTGALQLRTLFSLTGLS